jgi:hypothetical protein
MIAVGTTLSDDRTITVMMTRSEMLDAIIKDDIDTVKHARNGTDVLIELLYQGFSGYSNYTDEMLTDDLKGRGLYE